MEAVTPLLATLHPSAIVDSLHFQSCSSVKAQNKLKQNQSENESAERKEGNKEACPNKVGDGSGEHHKKTSRLQVMFSLSRVSAALINILSTDVMNIVYIVKIIVCICEYY